MAELKTKPNDASVTAFLDTIADRTKRADAETIVDLMRETTNAEPRMWGTSIIGFGNSHYEYASGQSGDWFQVGFSPRKQNLTLYLSTGLDENADLLSQLGKYTTGKSCLYIKRLGDVDLGVLRELLARSVR